MTPLETLAPIGSLEGRHVYDAPHDPAYARAQIALGRADAKAALARGFQRE